MRVTDELVERLGCALDACEFTTPYADVPSMLRRILEDVLLHVPGPGPHMLVHEAMWKQTQERLSELEGKLEALRTALRARSPDALAVALQALAEGKDAG